MNWFVCISYGSEICDDCLYLVMGWPGIVKYLDNTAYMTGFYITLVIVLFYFTALANIATLIHYTCTVAIPGLADWSAFLEPIVPTM